MKTIVQNACFPSHCTSEAAQLASVAKMRHSEMSDMDNFTFDGNFPKMIVKRIQYHIA